MATSSAHCIDSLIRAAQAAAKRAHAPYSNFRVGAALLAEDGAITVGCNVENASYGLTVCAERNALFAAVANGHRSFQALAIVAEPSDEPAPPCGACRQVLAEFCDDLLIVSLTPAGKRQDFTLSELLPHPFKPAP